MRSSLVSSAVVALGSALILSACGGRAADSTLLRESFDSGDTFSRTVDGRPGDACEAARRTLLSQGTPSPVPMTHRWKATRTSSRAKTTMSSWCCASPVRPGAIRRWCS